MIALGEIASLDYAWEDRDVILYALSIGARLPEDLSLLYEDGLRPAPTFALAAMAGLVMPMVAALEIELGSLLHAGQELVVHEQLPVAGRARVTRRVVEVVDKGRAALVVCEDAVGDWATGRSTWWIAGAGGTGDAGERGERSAPFTPPAPPDRSPTFAGSFATTPEQAALHRLNGDRNPVHIDPRAAAAAGQPRPFLHGLCTFGAIALALDRGAGPDRHLTGLAGRFTRPVFPGDTLAFEAWDDLAVARASVGGTPVFGPAAATYA